MHKAHYNPADKEDVISMSIEGENDTKMCHLHGWLIEISIAWPMAGA